ncbi:hypothetical protein Bca52824_042177 [Brassica carinata]|uniref:Uncharacterized protein n=1 Tax=Brassica carinata TaxID=52824 RepID=A0A8X7RU99_BRACI|nr:hypothetical protein Bca52824_042177 [Brassica carinata]
MLIFGGLLTAGIVAFSCWPVLHGSIARGQEVFYLGTIPEALRSLLHGQLYFFKEFQIIFTVNLWSFFCLILLMEKLCPSYELNVFSSKIA